MTEGKGGVLLIAADVFVRNVVTAGTARRAAARALTSRASLESISLIMYTKDLKPLAFEFEIFCC